MSNIGFIGLGIMGRPMAGHLIAGGHTLFAYNRSPVRQELIDAGEVQLVDVREPHEWDAGRIAGARHIELERLASDFGAEVAHLVDGVTKLDKV